MAAVLRHDEAHVRRQLRRLRERFGRDEWIIGGVDHEHRPRDAREVRPAARTPPVIFRVGEAGQPRGDHVVIGGERPCPPCGGEIHEPRVHARLFDNLSPHGPHEIRGVDGLGEAAVERMRAGCEVERDGDARPGPHDGGRVDAQLAEPFQQHVAAE